MRAAGAALLALFSSCVSASYNIERSQTRPPPDAFESLEIGAADLTQSLETLGAPLIVHELGSGAWMAWGWSHAQGWGASVSVPITNYYSVSFNYDDLVANLHGIVLFFDPDWQLVEKRRGYLRELLPTGRRRPQPVDLERR